MARYADRSDIMAIGDSMYQGVRSLTITADMARNSPPAIVARALRLPMSLALMRRPVLHDLEALLRQGGAFKLVSELRRTALANLDQWIAEPSWSDEEAFDNLAFGGAAISDLWTETYEGYWPKIAGLRQQLLDDPEGIGERLALVGQLWYALNLCFVLHPSRTATAQARASAIDQVARRRPRLLLVNIGSNEGLFRAAFSGSYDDEAKASIGAVPKKMKELGERLAEAMPADGKVYFNTILRPRFVPNLMPPGNDAPRPGEDYYPVYRPRIGNQQSMLSAAEMRRFDEDVAAANQGTIEGVREALKDRVVFVDFYDQAGRFDGKHFANRFVHVPKAHKRLRNTPLDSLFGGLNSGGLTGVDNMHPTVPGYTVIAQWVLDAMGKKVTLSMDAAYRADSLLQKLPLGLAFFQFEIGLLGSLGLMKGF